MEQHLIFGPVLSTMLLTFVVWLYMYAKRIPFLQSTGLDPNELTPTKLAQLSPPAVANPSDNFKNLFEIPVLFYALALYLYSTSQVDSTYITAAWVFFVFRALHSAVHCTINIVMLRFVLYVISSASVFFILLRAVAAYYF